MKKSSIFAVILALAFSLESHATVAVIIGLPTPQICRDEDGNDCQAGEDAKFDYVYSIQEVQEIVGKLRNENELRIKSARDELESIINQRELDVKQLAAKADDADKRIVQLEKAIRELSVRLGPVPAVAPLRARLRK